MKSRFPLLCVLLALCAAMSSLWSLPDSEQGSSEPKKIAAGESFDAWLDQNFSDPSSGTNIAPKELEQAIELAKLRAAEMLGAGAVTALAGGKQFHFASAEVLAEFDQRVAALDLEPGPHTGAQVIFLQADGDDGFDWEAAEGEVELQASAWTETPKEVYFIRIDFPDDTGASISQPDRRAQRHRAQRPLVGARIPPRCVNALRVVAALIVNRSEDLYPRGRSRIFSDLQLRHLFYSLRLIGSCAERSDPMIRVSLF